MTGHARTPPPSLVPGYADAVASGLTPARPRTAPALRPGPTAHQELIRCGVVLAGAAVVAVAAVLLAPTDDGQGTVPGMAMILSATVAGVVAIVLAIRRFRRVLLAELASGYVTTTFHQGMFWFTDRPGPKVGNDVVGWVWDGVWVLDPRGNVVSEPDPSVEPPGMYPSPNEPGMLELWTGSQWLGVHAEPEER